MISIFGISLLAMLVVIVYRKLNNRYQEVVFKSNLYKLRDELRVLAIEGKVDPNSIQFDYVDQSICKAAKISYYLTLFYIVFYDLKHEKAKKDIKEYKELYDHLQEKVKENLLLYQIDRKKNKFIHLYLLKQNQITRLIFLSLYKIGFGIKRVKTFFKNKIDSINFLPETSGISVC